MENRRNTLMADLQRLLDQLSEELDNISLAGGRARGLLVQIDALLSDTPKEEA
jgi:hypothetical protein